MRAKPSHVIALVMALVLAVVAAATVIVHFARSGGDNVSAPMVAASTPVSGLPTIKAQDLPREGVATLELIDRGGPFPYSQDGTIFRNQEGLLPTQSRDYYREYTVPTPGSNDRGRRRLVVGRLGDTYYTADHYESFRQVSR